MDDTHEESYTEFRSSLRIGALKEFWRTSRLALDFWIWDKSWSSGSQIVINLITPLLEVVSESTKVLCNAITLFFFVFSFILLRQG
jgi:hypothetical protein